MLNKYHIMLHAEPSRIYCMEGSNPESVGKQFIVYLMAHKEEIPDLIELDDYTKYPSYSEFKDNFSVFSEGQDGWLVDPNSGTKLIQKEKLFKNATILNIGQVS